MRKQVGLISHFERNSLYYSQKGFAKNRPATAQRPEGSPARGPRRPSGPQPAAARRPMMAQRPGPDFPPFFVQRLIHAYAQVYIGFGHAKWTMASLNSFTIIILNNHFEPFRSFHSLHVATCTWKMLSFSVYSSVYKTRKRGSPFSTM